MIDYAVNQAVFKTPKGNDAIFRYRQETSDWNTLWSALNEDEYRLGEKSLTGWAIDIGSHIGSVAVGLLIDNPELKVIAVEAVPENADLIRWNAAQNGVADRILVFNAAASAPGETETVIHYRYRGNENAVHHAFIGNSDLVKESGAPELEQETAVVACLSLGSLLATYRIDEPALIKIDCEGCEYGFLADPAIARCPLILGEWHPIGHHQIADMLALLDATHVVSFSGPQAGPGGFVAVRR